jgi:signal transduction histidine kinase
MDQVAVLGAERSTVDLAANAFEGQKTETSRIEYRAEATATLPDRSYLLVILCPSESDDIGLEAHSRLSALFVDTPVVVALPSPSSEMALRAVRLGAFDVLMLPPREEAVRDLIVRARTHRRGVALRRLATFSQFSGWLAHEIRNPLTGILSSAQLSIESSAPSDPIQRYLKIIIEEGDRLERFLRRVTELGRPVRESLVSSGLNTVVERALAHAAPRLKAQGIRLRRQLDPQLPEVRIEMTRMESAISRMIASAVEAMSAGGMMTVRTGRQAEGRMIELEVTDTNLTATQERQRQLFGPFASSRPRETGLGLAFAMQTFTEHGGDLLLRTDSGRGGSILARLPLNGQ